MLCSSAIHPRHSTCTPFERYKHCEQTSRSVFGLQTTQRPAHMLRTTTGCRRTCPLQHQIDKMCEQPHTCASTVCRRALGRCACSAAKSDGLELSTASAGPFLALLAARGPVATAVPPKDAPSALGSRAPNSAQAQRSNTGPRDSAAQRPNAEMVA
jgi:hypothetical protein